MVCRRVIAIGKAGELRSPTIPLFMISLPTLLLPTLPPRSFRSWGAGSLGQPSLAAARMAEFWWSLSDLLLATAEISCSVFLWSRAAIERVPTRKLAASHLVSQARIGFWRWASSSGTFQSFLQQTDLALNLSCLRHSISIGVWSLFGLPHSFFVFSLPLLGEHSWQERIPSKQRRQTQHRRPDKFA